MALEVRLSREMRLIDITMIGVGAMIGAGIFVLTGIAAGVAGPALILAFALNGVVALLTAMAYAELGSSFHDAGGGYRWIKTSLPDPFGFISGWMSWIAQAVACSVYALGFGAYFRLLLEFLGFPEIHLGWMSLEKWLAILTCATFAYINYRGASETGKAGNVVTVGKVVIIGAFILVGFWVMFGREGWEVSFHPFLTQGWGGVFAAMGLTFIAFEGYEIIAQTSEEVENPKRNVPRAIFLSLLIVVPIYLLVAVVALGAVNPPEGQSVFQFLAKDGEVALVTAAAQFVAGGGIVLLVGGLLSTLSALNATIYSSSRVALAMARDANLPQGLGRIHPERATPYISILFSAIIISGMAVLLPIATVAAAADIMFLLLFVQVNIALIKLRKQRPDLDRGFRVPLMPLTPVLAIVTMLFLAAFLFTHYPMAWVAAGGWIVAGLGLYYGYSRKMEHAVVEREKWMARIERKDYRVLVAISNPRTYASVLEAGIAIAKAHSGELVILSVVEVPEGVSLLTGRRKVRALEPLMDRAVNHAAGKNVDAYPVVKLARRVSHAIVETAREEQCNFLIIGRPDARSFLERIVASAVERVLQNAPCQVGVIFGKIEPGEVREILVPVTSGPHSELAAELAGAFGGAFGAPVRPITVVEVGTEKRERDAHVERAEATLKAAGLERPLEVLRRRDVLRGLARSVERGSLVLLGAPSSGPVGGLLTQTVPSEMARRRRNPVVVVREVEGRRPHRFERVFFGRR